MMLFQSPLKFLFLAILSSNYDNAVDYTPFLLLRHGLFRLLYKSHVFEAKKCIMYVINVP